jgi:hypothetical protein
LPNDRDVPLFVFDAGYDGIALGHGPAGTRADVLVRIASTRVFHPDPEPRRDGTMGRPRRHGPRFELADERTWTAPDAELVTSTRQLRQGDSDGLAQPASQVARMGPLAGLRGTADRQGQRGPGGCRAPAQTDGTGQEDAVAVVVRGRRARPRPVAADISALAS